MHSKPRIEHLTFTRYVAALTVVFFHYGAEAWPQDWDWIKPLLFSGPVAVSYFFVLSGFIMTYAYYEPDRPNNKIDAKKYYLARFARVYPVYALALAVMVLARLKSNDLNLFSLLLNITMLQAWLPGQALTINSPGWSLSVEAFFYLVFPFIITQLHRKHFWTLLLWATPIMWLTTQCLLLYGRNHSSYAPHSGLHELIYYHPVMHLNTFCIGIIAAIYFSNRSHRVIGRPVINELVLCLLLLCMAVLLLTEPNIEAYLGFNIDYNNGLMAPIFILFILVLASNRGRLAKFLSIPVFVALGEASYSLYILQRPVYGVFDRLTTGWSPEMHFSLFVLVLTCFALLSYYAFETPMRQWVRQISNSSGKSTHQA